MPSWNKHLFGTCIASQRSPSMVFCFVSGDPESESCSYYFTVKRRDRVCPCVCPCLHAVAPLLACLKQHQRPQTLRPRTHALNGPSTPPVRRISPSKPHVCHRFLSPLIIMAAVPHRSRVGSPQRPPTTSLGCSRHLAQRATTRLL